jgi:hypothetical protein
MVHTVGSHLDRQHYAQAYGCDVHKTAVYVAGVVKDGAVMAGESAGKNDLFVSQLSAATGDVNSINRMGSSENEQIAHGSGITRSIL